MRHLDLLALFRARTITIREAPSTPECLGDDLLAELVEGTVDPEQRIEALRHVARCRSCGHAVASLARVLTDPAVAAAAEFGRRLGGIILDDLHLGHAMASLGEMCGESRLQEMLGAGSGTPPPAGGVVGDEEKLDVHWKPVRERSERDV
jgi:hypothetical protein